MVCKYKKLATCLQQGWHIAYYQIQLWSTAQIKQQDEDDKMEDAILFN